jgi:TolB protein
MRAVRRAKQMKQGGWRAMCWLVLLFVAGCLPDEVPVTVTRVTAEPTPIAAEPTATTTPTLTTSPPTAAPTPTPSATSSPTPFLTHTPTPIATMRPFPTVTPPFAFPVKQVFLQFGAYGGDGGQRTDIYYGRDAPLLTIYTDGQVVVREGDREEGRTFLEATISSDEMCHLLAQIQSSGFLEEIEPIYAFPDDYQESMGGGEYIIQLNGPRPKLVNIYSGNVPYLVEPMAEAFELISNYRPPNLSVYQPSYVLLWVEEFEAIEGSQPWPESLPLADLWQDRVNPEVLIVGEWVEPVMALFEQRLSDRVFVEDGQHYLVIARPLLPDETASDFPVYATTPVATMPFSCDDPALLPVIPTPTIPVPTPTATIDPAALELNGRIAFVSERDGNQEIYVMNGDGSNVTRLTNHWARDDSPVWSPDGQQIAFNSNRDGNEEIYVMNADGTNVTRITFEPSRDYISAWSPDGQWLAFVTERHGDPWMNEFRIYWIRPDGSEEQRWPSSVVAQFSPGWSPDGQFVVYGQGDVIYRAEVDGSNADNLGFGGGPVWSPNGEQIAFLNQNNIFVMNADGSQRRPVTDSRNIWERGDWSPDSQFIVFSRADELYVVNVVTEEEIRLTSNSFYDGEPAWWP